MFFTFWFFYWRPDWIRGDDVTGLYLRDEKDLSLVNLVDFTDLFDDDFSDLVDLPDFGGEVDLVFLRF